MKNTLSFALGKDDFTHALIAKVEEYFSSTMISQKGNKELYIKTTILFISLITLYYLIVFLPMFFWVKALLCIPFGLNIAAIGFNIMHDGGHGSYSHKKWVNKVMALTLNLVGGNANFWHVKHNIRHHTFPNVEHNWGDEDIYILPLIRTNFGQLRYWFHQYQYKGWYWPTVYSLTYILWIFFNDSRRYITRKVRKGDEPIKISFGQHVVFWFSKAIFFTLSIVIPLFFMSFIGWLVIFFITTLVCGFTIALTFQLAHIVPIVFFPIPNEKNELEQNFMLHQLKTTADFAPNNKFLCWILGGLNFQVEHHLFPRISHVHYPAVRKIVLEVCNKFSVQHFEYPTLGSAVGAHILYLKKVGAK